MSTRDTAFIGRQPILNASGEIFGYDLLFRNAMDATEARFASAVQATAAVITELFGTFGVDSILGSAVGFIHADPNLLIADHIAALPKERIVLGIPSMESVSSDFFKRVQSPYYDGVQICLDNYELKDSRRELLPFVRYVRIDVTKQARLGLLKLARQMQNRRIKTIAARVESREGYSVVKKHGYKLFQGYFFAKPEMVATPRLTTRRSHLLKLIYNIQNSTPVDDIANWIREVPQLQLNLLNLVRCVDICPGTKIESVGQAIVMIGQDKLSHWLHLLLYAGDNEQGVNNPLCALAATRSRAMEELAQVRSDRLGGDDAETIRTRASLTGLLSLAPPLLNIQMDNLVTSLPIHDDVKAALLHGEGTLGQLLQLQEKIEAEDPVGVDHLLDQLKLTCEDLETCQVEAMIWANGLEAPRAGESARYA